MSPDRKELLSFVREAGSFCDVLTSPEDHPGMSSIHLYAQARAIATKARRLLAEQEAAE